MASSSRATNRTSALPVSVALFYWGLLSPWQRILAAVALLGIPIALTNWLSADLGWLVFFFLAFPTAAILNFYRNYFSSRRKIRGRQSSDVKDIITSVKPSVREADHGYVVYPFEHRPDSFLASDAVDSNLQRNSAGILLREQRARRNVLLEHLRDDPEFCRDILFYRHSLARQARTRVFRDDRKLSLLDTPLPESKVLEVHESSYFLGCLTNDMCEWDYFNQGKQQTPRPIWVAIDEYPFESTGSRTIRELGDTGLSNHIGVSTVLLSSDRKIVLWRHGESADRSVNRIVPTSSGSLDYEDFDMLRSKPKSLENVILAGAGRELTEECAIDGAPERSVGAESELAILGYFRWVSKGGKPEFSVIGRIDVRAAQIIPNNNELERPAGDKLIFDAHDETSLKNAIKEICAHRDAAIPLLACMRSLRVAIEKNVDIRKSLFG